MIESYLPTLPKIELRARSVVPRPGWDVWGLEAPASADHCKIESQVGEMMSPTFA
jgi:N6-adenosine-specific RNA methylase IME4